MLLIPCITMYFVKIWNYFSRNKPVTLIGQTSRIHIFQDDYKVRQKKTCTHCISDRLNIHDDMFKSLKYLFFILLQMKI